MEAIRTIRTNDSGVDMRTKRPSELEGVVLGILHGLGPCSAYRVRRELKASPSTHWSASAGSVYPLLGRLEKSGLVRGASDPADGRGRRLLSLTAAGRRAHRDWLLTTSSPAVAANVSDAARARAFSLEALPPRDRVRFARQTLAALEQFVDETRNYLTAQGRSGNRYRYLASLGGLYQAEARVKWMRELLAHVEEDER